MPRSPRRRTGGRPEDLGGGLTVCLAYPNLYRTGMSNLGFQAVYALINRHPACLCERVFLPDSGDEAVHIASPGSLFSLESQRPLVDFDMVAFSLSFENDYPNILKILEMAGIPLHRGAQGRERPPHYRRRHRRHPESRTPRRLLRPLSDRRRRGPSPRFPRCGGCSAAESSPGRRFSTRYRRRFPGRMSPGVIRSSTIRGGRIAAREPLDCRLPPADRPALCRRHRRLCRPNRTITTESTEFGGMFLTEVSRGCRRGCRFCAAGFVCRPARFRSAAALEASFRRGLEKRKTIGLLGTAVSDHPALIPLCRSILDRGGSVAVGSLRLDRLNGPMAALLKETGRGNPRPRPRGRLPAPPGRDPQGDHRSGDLLRSGQSPGI